MDYLEPWVQCNLSDKKAAEKELKIELSEVHVLYGLSLNALARRIDRDDVLFQLNEGTRNLVSVHLTYSGKKEENPQYPQIEEFASLDEWTTYAMMKDHEEYLR